ncbi:hypothetical protein [Hymenobacter sp. ISL-91]
MQVAHRGGHSKHRQHSSLSKLIASITTWCRALHYTHYLCQ